MLNRLNTRGTGFAGLAIGGAAIIAAVVAFFKLLTDPQYLTSLARALYDVHHATATDADHLAIAQLVAATLAIVGALVVALLSTYFGRPSQIPDSPVSPKGP
jgi:hypothetical protein